MLVAGSAGSGKTSWTMQQLERCERLLVWDSAGEWSRHGCLPVVTLAELGERVRSDVRREMVWRAAYSGPTSRAHFHTWCSLAWVWLRAHPRGVLVVEELADVTAPGKAPPAWGEIVRKHRHTQGAVYALTQRPAESDKTILGNATVIHCGRLNMARDRAYMAAVLDVPEEHVTALEDLQFIERNMRTRLLTVGRVTF